MGLLFGIIFIVLGFVFIKWGDKPVTETFLDRFAHKISGRDSNDKYVKFGRKLNKLFVGIICIAVGSQFLLIHFGISHSFFGTPVKQIFSKG